MRCCKILDDGTQCPNTTKVTSFKCWKKWGLCGQHAAEDYPEQYPKAKGHKTGGRIGKQEFNTNLLTLEIPQKSG